MRWTRFILLIGLMFPLGVTAGETKSIENISEYWLMPTNLVAKTCNQMLNGETIFGEHCFWSGEFHDKTCYLQGDPSMTRYDVMEIDDGKILYWGSFRGNGKEDPVSHSFGNPMLWMKKKMRVGKEVDSTVFVEVLNPATRKIENNGLIKMRLEFIRHYQQWTLPETGEVYDDVIEVAFWSDANRPETKELYHLAHGKGTIRFESSNVGEPSGVKTAWAVEFYQKEINEPVTPWFKLFEKQGSGRVE